MKGQYLLAALLTAAALTPAHAGILFGRKKPPADPSQRVPELVGQVKSSPDEAKRSQAAEELRKYDPQAFPDMIPVLLDVLAHDPKAPVRAEAAHSLGKLRPVSVPVGQALEQALAKDKSMRVRIQAQRPVAVPLGGLPDAKKERPAAADAGAAAGSAAAR